MSQGNPDQPARASKKVMAGAAAGLALGVIGALTWSSLSSRPETPATAVASDQVQPPATPRPAQQSRARDAGTDPTSAAGTMASMPSKAELLAQAQREYARQEAIWAKDAVDPVKAAEFERKINSVMEAPRFKSELRDLPTRYTAQCKASLCRIEASFPDDNSDADSWLTRVLMDVGGGVIGNSKAMALPQPDGSYKVVIYGYRPGHAPAGL